MPSCDISQLTPDVGPVQPITPEKAAAMRALLAGQHRMSESEAADDGR